ncbi:MAG TPA: hypothetical protein PLS96_10530 [Myxococcota bacterium]|nr:hypothetical protein [Myxococcota bacterium]HQE74401.1 hypothetical protein [Myxococcota bacterium]HQI62337.1 hypothetical protein [Myxococcota bacterium]HRR74007.1 hypothetical protein [Myxococcota bacterium]HRV17804.1 hypothetical protein [Myxococcota bacterium]
MAKKSASRKYPPGVIDNQTDGAYMNKDYGGASGDMNWFYLRVAHGKNGYHLSTVLSSSSAKSPDGLLGYVDKLFFSWNVGGLKDLETIRAGWVLIAPDNNNNRTGYLMIAQIRGASSADPGDKRYTENVEVLAVKVPEGQALPSGLVNVAQKLFSNPEQYEPSDVSAMLAESYAPTAEPQGQRFRRLASLTVAAVVQKQREPMIEIPFPSALEPSTVLEWMWELCPPALRPKLTVVLGFESSSELAVLESNLRPQIWVDLSAAEGTPFESPVIPDWVEDYIDIVMSLSHDKARRNLLNELQYLAALVQPENHFEENWWWALFVAALNADSRGLSNTFLAWAIAKRKEHTSPWSNQARQDLLCELANEGWGILEVKELFNRLKAATVAQYEPDEPDEPAETGPGDEFPGVAKARLSFNWLSIAILTLLFLIFVFQVRVWMDNRDAAVRTNDDPIEELPADPSIVPGTERPADPSIVPGTERPEDSPTEPQAGGQVPSGAAATSDESQLTDTDDEAAVHEPAEEAAAPDEAAAPEEAAAPAAAKDPDNDQSKVAFLELVRPLDDAIAPLTQAFDCKTAAKVLQALYEPGRPDGDPRSLIKCHKLFTGEAQDRPGDKYEKLITELEGNPEKREAFIQLFKSYRAVCPEK